MPDTRTQRGPHPRDRECFSTKSIPVLRRAVSDFSWLLERGYSNKASLKLVGDKHSLRDRQRKALQRCAASPGDCRRRRRSMVDPRRLQGSVVEVDGYNVLLSIEAALSGGVLLLARDGTIRDLAAMSAHYRRVDTTRPAVGLLADFFERSGCREVHWYLDRPVSNSGRLRGIIESETLDRPNAWRVELADGVDQLLKSSPYIVATADSAILDRCKCWVNLARLVIERSVPEPWLVDLSRAAQLPPTSGRDCLP